MGDPPQPDEGSPVSCRAYHLIEKFGYTSPILIGSMTFDNAMVSRSE